jgi:hypothetical protein
MGIHEHMQRTQLPWRGDDDVLTECGLPADPRTTLTRGAMIAKIAREGKERAAMSSCMTCWTAATRHREEGDGDLVAVVQREVERVHWRQNPARKRLLHELKAIVSLIETHRAEFDTLVRDFGEVVPLAEQRRKRGKRA